MKALKIIGLVVGILLLLLGAGGAYLFYKARNITDTQDLEVRVDRAVEQAMEENGIPGIGVVVIRGDRTYIKSFGSCTDSTVLEIGSITKVFTALIAQRLVDDGTISWQDHVFDLLPDTVRPDVDDGTTLLHLATHTSGLPRLPEFFLASLTDTTCDPYRDLTVPQVLEAYARKEGKATPENATYDYSNYGMGLLGHLLELRTGLPYDSLVQRWITDPLGMSTTSGPRPGTARTMLARGHDADGEPTCAWHFGALGPAGALLSTPQDMALFLRAAMEDDPSLAHAFSATMRPQRSIPNGKVGFAWHVDDMTGVIFGMKPFVWHNGGTGGFSSYMALQPEERIGVVVLADRSNATAVDGLGLKLLLQAHSISFGQ